MITLWSFMKFNLQNPTEPVVEVGHGAHARACVSNSVPWWCLAKFDTLMSNEIELTLHHCKLKLFFLERKEDDVKTPGVQNTIPNSGWLSWVRKMMYSKPTECVSQLVYSFWRLEAERFGKRVGWVFVSFFLVETHGEMRGGHLRVESDFTPNLSKAIQKYTRATPMKSNRKNMMIWRLLTFLCGSR